MESGMKLIDYLKTRRSVPPLLMSEPGPDRAEIESILTLATRVPDHGKLAPWRFVVYSGEARARIGEELARLALDEKPDLTPEAVNVEKTRLTLAPVVIAVVSTAAPHVKIPEWEQVLSAGAVCLNLLMAANAHGYAANWLTQWYAYDERAHAVLGLHEGEKIAGFIHIGTMARHPGDRARPDIEALVTWVEA